MNYFNIDFLIVYTFLAITLVIGIRAGRGIKDIREYAIGSGSFGIATLVFTFLATNIGGISTLDAASDVFSNGIIYAIAALGVIIQLLLVGIFITPYIKYFNDCLTMGDVMGSLYGRYSQILTGILGTLYSFCMIGMELLILGVVGKSLLGIPASVGVVLGGILLTTYSAYGGIKAVTATDIFQFLILFIVIPLVASLALNKVGGIQEVFAHVPADKLEVFTHKKFSFYLTLFLIWSVLPLGLVSPPHFQRLLIAKQPDQLRQQYFILAGLDPLIRVTIMIIGLAGLVLYPQIQSADVMPHIIKELLPIGLKGFAIAGMLAVVMSRTDSYLNTAGLMLVHDVIKPILGRKQIFLNELKWTQYSTFLIGIVSIIIGLRSTNALGLSFGAMRIAGPVLLFPLLAGIIGIKPDKKTFYGAMVVTLLTFAITTLLLPKSHSHLGMPISIVANAISFLIIHFIQNGKIVMVDRSTYEVYNTLVKPHHRSIQKWFRYHLLNLSNIIQYSQNRIKEYGAPYILFGIFYGINFTYPYFMWSTSGSLAPDLILTLRLIGALACGLLVVKSKWPRSMLPYMPTYWHLSVMYCLPFMSTMMFLLTQGSTEWLINIAIMIILLFILVDWATALVLGSVGIMLAFSCYFFCVGKINLSLDFSSKYLLLYQGIFGLLIGLIFARRKQQRFDRLATEKETLTLIDEENKEALLETFKEKIRLLKTLKRAGVQDLTKAVSLVKELRIQEKQGFKQTTVVHKALDQLQNTLTPMAVALEKIESRATDYMRLEIEPITIDSLLAPIQPKFPDTNFHIKNSSTCLELICDPKRIQKILVNSIEVLKACVEEGEPIYITLADSQLTYSLPSVKKDKSYVKKVSALAFILSTTSDIPSIQTTYKAQMHTSALPMPETPVSLLLVSNQRIVKAHYGYTNIDISKQENYDMHCYVLPTRVSDVRPRDMDDPYMELGAELVRANDTFPGALEQEKAFLAAVKQKSNANITAIETAIEMIKWYHGPVKRKSGEPFYLHPLAVAQIVLEYNTDEATILGALLHDTVEDTSMLLENLEMMFGKEVVGIVNGVTHFESMQESFYKVQLAPHENIMMLLGVEDKRVLYVKIADRMHNMRTIEGHSSYAKKKQIAEETLQFFVPLAQKLDLEVAAAELQERSVAVINQQK
jgi:Na+/proline symporter